MASLSQKDKRGIMLMAVVGVLLAIAFVANYQLSNKAKPDERNCVEPVARKTAIVIDRSDDTPTQTVDEIVARIRKYVAEAAQENELISVFEVSGQSTVSLRPIFSKCLPRKDGNDLYEHRRSIQKYYKEQFEKPLAEALARPPATSETSPIAEVVSDLSASDHLRSQQSRLIVFSDLMQNSKNGSLYACASSDQAVQAYRNNKAGSIERPTFTNTAVELHVIPREGLAAPTVECRMGFWTWFFGDSEGTGAGLDFNYLPGGAAING